VLGSQLIQKAAFPLAAFLLAMYYTYILQSEAKLFLMTA
jgi:hypothetical protein